MSSVRRKLWLLAAAVLPAVSAGCNPLTLGLWTPVPVQPWVAERIDNKVNHKNDGRVPIMPPVRAGYPPPICEDPPSDLEVLRAIPRVPRGVPYIYEEFRDDVVIVKNRLVDQIDPPRFFPLVGPAQLHHCHYRVTVYFDEIKHSSYPFSWEVSRPNVEVLYIDRDHLHICVSPEMEAIPESYRDIYGTY